MSTARPVAAVRAPVPVGLAVLVVVLVLSMGLGLRVGSVSAPWETVFEVVARRLRLGSPDVTVIDDQIIWQLRMPRVLAAAAVGAALGIVGAVLQSLTRNDLADPYLLGVSAGATVGAVSVIVLGVSIAGVVGTAALTLAAFVGALAALAMVLVLAVGRSGALPPSRAVLAGIIVSQICAAFTSFVVLKSGQQDAPRRVLSWTLGSFGGVRWGHAVLLLVVATVAVVAVLFFSRHLDAFAFGDTAARSLGVPTERVRWALLVGTALVVATMVAFTGAIGFVGLVVPHIIRLIFGPGHLGLLPLSALGGACLMVLSDTLARSVMPGQEIPVGVITAAIGAPVFALLLRRDAARS
nr:iron chelate uptake ABC transporter family permease subunit [Nocardioides speluncae]